MKRISISRTSYSFENNAVETEPIAAFVVSENGIDQVEFGEASVPARMPIVDVETGARVTLESNPIRWAELLPSAYRSGDYAVTVEDLARPEIVLAGAGGVAAAEAEALHVLGLT